MKLYAVAHKIHESMVTALGLMAPMSSGPKDKVVLNSSPDIALAVSGLNKEDALIIEVDPLYIGVDDLVYDRECLYKDSFFIDYGLPSKSLSILSA